MQSGNGWDKHDSSLAFGSHQTDKYAFEEVYRKYVMRVKGLLARLNGHGSALDDLTQQVFTEFVKHGRRYRSDDSIRAYLFGIAVNVLREHRRRARRAPVGLRDMSWLSNGSRPDDVAASHEQRDQLVRAVLQAKAKLSAKQLQAIELFDILCLAVREAAEVAHCSAQAFQGCLRRARGRLPSIPSALDTPWIQAMVTARFGQRPAVPTRKSNIQLFCQPLKASASSRRHPPPGQGAKPLWTKDLS